MDISLEKLKKTMENNGRVLELYAAYLNNEPCLVESDTVKSICDDCHVSTEQAFAAILSAAFGLDGEENADDLVIERKYVERSVKRLDPAVFKNDPYYKNIKIPEIKLGKWELKYESFKPYEGFIYDDLTVLPDLTEIPNLGFFEEEFPFAAVLEDGREWMMITPNEINTMKEPIKKARGRVVTFGLGMGYYTYMVSRKEEVESVTVVERDPGVISLFKEYILPKFEFKDKVNIICADAFSYAETVLPGGRFDVVFADMWHDVSDGLDMYIRLKRLERLTPDAEFTYWVERSLLSELRKMVFETLVSKEDMTASRLLPMLSDDYLMSLAGDIRKA